MLEQADQTGDYSKLTPNNLVELLSEIGGFNYYPDPDNEFKQLNALDEFMNQLPPGNIAKNNMGQRKLDLIKRRKYFINGNHGIESIYSNENCKDDFSIND